MPAATLAHPSSTCPRARNRELSTSFEDDGRSGDLPLLLPFDVAFPYAGTDVDERPLPRLPLAVALDEAAGIIANIHPVLDSGADHSASGCTVALHLGWDEGEIERRGRAARPIHGVAARGPALVGYLHELTCFLPLGRCFARLRLHVFLTPPNTLWTPVLGRRDFFEQVDFALLEAERRFCPRFREPSVLGGSW